MELPDAKKHQQISFIKSGIRIFGYLLLFGIPFAIEFAIWAALILIVSEIVGVVEELV